MPPRAGRVENPRRASDGGDAADDASRDARGRAPPVRLVRVLELVEDDDVTVRAVAQVDLARKLSLIHI